MAITDASATLVLDSYNRSVELANSATESLNGFTEALNASVYTAPKVDVKWSSLTTPPPTTLPSPPSLNPIVFQEPHNIPEPLDGTIEPVQIENFTKNEPVLSIGPAPALNFGEIPVIPAIGAVTVPSAPAITLPSEPAYLSISTPIFGGIDLHEGWLDRLDSIPELQLLRPDPMDYVRGKPYASPFLKSLQATLAARIRGGTGLPADAEQAIWDRARDRETQIALAGEAEAMRGAEALGFALPIGTLAAQVADARRVYHDKLSSLSRDIAIKQAELEQENLKQAIAVGMELEGKLMNYSLELEKVTFEAAKAVSENAVQVYNAGVDHYKTLLAAYQAYAATYKTIIDAELSKVEVYKAQLQGELAKAQVNTAMTQQYKAQVDAAMSQVEIYKAQVGAANVLVQLEQSKLQAAGEQIRAFTATVSAEVARVDVFKAQVSGEVAKVEAFKSSVQAYSAKAGAQAEKARVNIARFAALGTAKAAEWEGYRARMTGESVRIEALAKNNSLAVEGYKLASIAASSSAELSARQWESNIKQYEASQNLTLQTAKVNMDALISANAARMDVAKTGAQIYAQQVASAYNIVNTNASISSSTSSVFNMPVPGSTTN